MTRITTIGLDIAKSVFQVHAIDSDGKVVVAKALRRAQMHAFFAKLEPCLIGIEACGSAHYWARELTKLDHIVRLMPPKYVKAYVKRGKTDAGDAEAICEAVTRKTMTFVPAKPASQQALAMLHGVRETLIGQRTQAINALRGHLSELGVIAPQGLIGLAQLAAIVRDEADHRLPGIARDTLKILLAQIEATSQAIAGTDAALKAEHKASAESRALETVPSIGPVIASALRARVGNAKVFENGRHMAAWIGLVPEQDSSGGKTRQRGISKKGDRYLRRLLVSGAMALVQHAQRKPGKYPWIVKLLARMHPKAAAVAIANKTARIAWAILARGGTYDAAFHAARPAPTALAATV
jgi:transposase